MKLILGDNQFFGINHSDLTKGAEVEKKFQSTKDIYDFINFALENGMLSLLKYITKNISFTSNIANFSKFLVYRNFKTIIPLATNLEIPKNLPKGSYVYLQNILTDLLIGLGKQELILEFIDTVNSIGYKPGLITLNPIKLTEYLSTYKTILNDLVICYNVNKIGFNTFPNLDSIEKFSNENHSFKKMGMSVLSSGSGSINESIEYIKNLNLDYVVFGTSKKTNLVSNIELFNKT